MNQTKWDILITLNRINKELCPPNTTKNGLMFSQGSKVNGITHKVEQNGKVLCGAMDYNSILKWTDGFEQGLQQRGLE